jgi:DNA polymerase-1
MLQYKWTSVNITTNKQANDMIRLFRKLKPKIGGQDTETTGLHIINDKPFIFQFGFLHPTERKGYTYLVDLERQPILAHQVMRIWLTQLAPTLDIYFGHNIKYELHMNTNVGFVYTTENLSDTMFYIRYAHDALSEKNGGPPLSLKAYAAQYIDYRAKDHERLLASERSQKAKDYNLRLKFRLKNKVSPPKYKAKSYTLSVLEEIFKDPIADITDLPEDIRQDYLDWLTLDLPLYLQHKVTGLVESDMIRYDTLNRQHLYTYAHFDIIYMLEIYLLLDPVVKARQNTIGIDFENKLILPLYEMERVGFKIDKQYLEDSRIRLKDYILQRRQRAFELAGQEFKIGQHALIKNILNNNYQIKCNSTNAQELDLILSELKQNNPEHPGIEFIEVIQELRTLEKWYSTYIIRFLNELKTCDKLYTTINQVGTVSGRVTSDFQQFPRDVIKTIDGVELFHPRKMVVPTGDDYNAIIYLDYSQIELRFQAFYTILVGHPDLNLCRAYMPYRCRNKDNIAFDPSNIDHIRAWQEPWFLEENPEIQWTPTDVHGVTTEKATGLTPDHPDFKTLRSKIGKPVNFAKNYGAQRQRIRQMFPTKSEEEITRINDAYYLAFPGVKHYHDYCYARAQAYAYTENLFGIKYYGVSGHKLINLLIQGSAAYYLKWKIRQLWEYTKANGIKSRFQMNIHDELSWERHKTETEVFFEFQRIMQDWPDTQVPIVAEMDVTTTTWADKKGVNNLEELRLYLGN